MTALKICLSEAMADRLESEITHIAPDAELVHLRADGSYDGDPSGVHLLCFSNDLAEDAVLGETWKQLQSESLRWVQAPAAGIDNPIWGEIIERGVRLTTAAGIHAEPIAQYIFTYILHWERQVARHQRQQAERRWDPVISDDLTTKTLGIVGLGGIGSAAARVAKAFGMRVLGLRRGETDDPNIDRSFTPDDLIPLLEQSDYVVLSVPLTGETEHLIGADELAAMGEDTVLVNVARGGVVDEVALVDALERRVIRGAALDVVDVEPLAPDSRLWDLRNCIITPHDAGYSPVADERLGRLFIDNLAHYVDDTPMRNEVDPTRPS